MDLKLLEEELAEPLKRAGITITPRTIDALKLAKEREEGPAKAQIEAMLKSIEISMEKGVPLCQDTGTPHFYVQAGFSFPTISELGKIRTAIVNAIRRVTRELPLRPNTVDLITGKNPGDNTGRRVPYIIWKMKEGDDLRITYLPKGGGSENMSQLTMMLPGRGLRGVKEIILDRIVSMGGKPCPPTIIGVGLGGSATIAMDLAKEALLRSIGERHEQKEIADLELELIEMANELGIGPMGMGGKTTVLDVHVEYAHRHPATYPVAIIPQCWANRRVSVSVKPDGSFEMIE